MITITITECSRRCPFYEVGSGGPQKDPDHCKLHYMINKDIWKATFVLSPAGTLPCPMINQDVTIKRGT